MVDQVWVLIRVLTLSAMRDTDTAPREAPRRWWYQPRVLAISATPWAAENPQDEPRVGAMQHVAVLPMREAVSLIALLIQEAWPPRTGVHAESCR